MSIAFRCLEFGSFQTLGLGCFLKRAFFIIFLVCLLATVGESLWLPDRYYEVSIYTSEYGLNFYPDYPPVIDDTVTLRLRTFAPAQKMTLVTDRDVTIPMTFSQGHWWGKFHIPADYQAGWHFFTVWIKHSNFLGSHPTWSKSVVWYRADKKTLDETRPGLGPLKSFIPLPPEISAEVEEIIPPVTGEAVTIKFASQEAAPLKIKGSQNITFKSRSLIGSREGYLPGTQQTREETLRLNISGRAAETDIEASLNRTSALSSAQLSANDEEISILMRRGSTEVYLGDFDAALTETDFGSLTKRLSGGRLKSEQEKWGATLLYSSPKGQAKYERFYGNNTQGPYSLASAPIIIASERVKVDSQIKKRGDDYTVDYQAGTITFTNTVINIKSIIEINYDFRQTVYQHATYGLRAYFTPQPALKLGVTYLDDSDSLANAAAIRGSMSQEAINPASHYLVSVDSNYAAQNLTAKTELAYSVKNFNLLGEGTTEAGRAVKIELNSNFGSFGLELKGKRIGAQFLRIAEVSPKQDVWDYGGSLSFRPGQLLGAQTDYTYQKYRQNGVVYENRYRTAKTVLTPDKLPSLEYNFNENDESNDPVTGSVIQRVVTKNALAATYQWGIFSSSLKGGMERWLKRSPSAEATDYKRVNVSLATVGLEKISFAANVEYEKRNEPDGRQPTKRSGDLNLSFTPNKAAFVSASFQLIDDTVAGPTNVADLSYRFQAADNFRTEGKYTINSVRESFPTTTETIAKQAGSFSFDWRPQPALRLRYLYKPNFTLIARTQSLSYNNEQQQAEINLLPASSLWLGALYKLGRAFTINRSDYPNYALKDRTEATDSALYTIKLAPLAFISLELNHLQENGYAQTLVSTLEPRIYTPGKSVSRNVDLLAKTSLSEKLSLDCRYTFQKIDQGSGEGTANLTDTKSHTVSLKALWNISDVWSWSLAASYARATDYRLGNTTYTWSPGMGFIYRLGDVLRLDGDYIYTRSYAAADTEKHNYLLKARYAVSDFVNWTLQAQHEISRWPDYRLTDITGNVAINF
ncbi:hypothetical protein HZB07_02960 [Candidatus Saganbacteria bacterium]|nr:hypothetical protein [Candidatus Saganbacteria bacterium]